MLESLIKNSDTIIPALIFLGVTIPILILIGIAYAIRKWAPTFLESHKKRSDALVTAVETTIPAAIKDFKEGLSSAENNVKTHVSREVGGLREEIQDKRAEKIDEKLTRIEMRSSIDLEHDPPPKTLR